MTITSEEKTAILFPGQGAQCAEMLQLILQNETTKTLLSLASNLIDTELSNAVNQDKAFFKNNDVSAMLVCLSNLAAYENLKTKHTPTYVMGYSVGQWSALHAAGMIGSEGLLAIVAKRARLMNQTSGASKGGMLAVIGLTKEKIQPILCETKGYVIIANENAPGQYTLSGEMSVLNKVEKKLARLSPQKLLRVPVAGAWHSAMVEGAVRHFAEYLEGVTFQPPTCTVINNVNGKPIPKCPDELKKTLASHIASPVLWIDGIRYLIKQDVQHFIETGYSNTLSKFGFFIDRSRVHTTWDRVC